MHIAYRYLSWYGISQQETDLSEGEAISRWFNNVWRNIRHTMQMTVEKRFQAGAVCQSLLRRHRTTRTFERSNNGSSKADSEERVDEASGTGSTSEKGKCQEVYSNANDRRNGFGFSCSRCDLYAVADSNPRDWRPGTDCEGESHGYWIGRETKKVRDDYRRGLRDQSFHGTMQRLLRA